MDTLAPLDAIGRFKAPASSLGDLDAESAATVIAAAADVALVVDRAGIVRDMALSAEGLAREGFQDWIGQPFVDTVTVESRPKVEELLRDAEAAQAPRWRQVNHPSPRGPDIPVRYSAVMAGSEGRIVALGRDLSAMAVLQQRLIEAQLSMEREYARLRHSETRYRLLFQVASEAVIVVDAATHRIVEANPAASRALGAPAATLAGRPLVDLFEAEGAQVLQELLSKARAGGRADGALVRLPRTGGQATAAASMFRQETGAYFLLRLTPAGGSQAPGIAAPSAEARLGQLIGAFPEGFVVTRPDRRILTANRAFLDLAQVASDEHAVGEPLDRWLGRSAVDFNVLFGKLREHGSVRHFPTVLRGEYGSIEDVEISAVSVPEGEEPCIGFVVRPLARRPFAELRAPRQLPRSVEQLTELIGRVPLKDLVRETTDVIERLCIEAALELTGDNRASAAQMLGLSRQSLYVKLRRYGLADSADEAEEG